MLICEQIKYINCIICNSCKHTINKLLTRCSFADVDDMRVF